MAKKKIEQTEIEAPYELPEGWKWVRFRDICNVYGRIGFRGYTKDDLVSEGEGAISLSPSNMKDMKLDFSNCTYISWEKYEESPEIMLEVGDVVVVKTASVGRTAYVDYLPEKTTLNPQIMVLKNISVNHKLVNYYLNTIYAVQMIQKLVNGTAIPTFSQEKFLNEPFPLPPTLEEQQRIVSRIETLFAKLDQAKEKAQNVVDTFETRKASILHKAFTGELTKKWREENGVGDDIINNQLLQIYAIRDNLISQKVIQKAKLKQTFNDSFIQNFETSWKVVKLGAIAFITKLAGFEYSQYIHLEETGEIPAIRAQNVRKGYLDETNLLYISKETSDFLQRSALTKPSVLITFIGAGIGDVCIFDKKERYHLAPNVAKVELYSNDKSYTNIRYVLYYLLSQFGQHEIFKDMKATAQPSLSMETIRDIEIPIPSISEQKEIVSILDCVLEKENQAKEAALAVLEQIDLLKKSILARAFRGEL